MVQNRRTRRISEILTIKGHDIEVGMSLNIWGLLLLVILMMKYKKSKLESQLLIKPVPLCKLCSDLNILTEIIK